MNTFTSILLLFCTFHATFRAIALLRSDRQGQAIGVAFAGNAIALLATFTFSVASHWSHILDFGDLWSDALRILMCFVLLFGPETADYIRRWNNRLQRSAWRSTTEARNHIRDIRSGKTKANEQCPSAKTFPSP